MHLFLNILVTFLCMPWPALIMMSPMMIAAPGFATKKSSILMAMVFFCYPAFIFIVLHLIGYRFYGTNPLWWAGVAVALGTLVSILYRLPQQLVNICRGISNYGYFITRNTVYYNGQHLTDSDARTFTNFNERGYYSKDKNHVYYTDKKLADADAAMFQPLANDDTHSYWHDKKNAYHTWNKIPNADGATFTYAGHNYAYDKNTVFFQHEPLKGADRTTFQPLEMYIGRDTNNVFVRATQVTNIKDLATFEVFTREEEIFGKDKEQIYALFYSPPHPFVPFPNADLETFEVVGEHYAKDKNQVYYYSNHNDEIVVLEHATPENFTLHFDSLRNTDATDGERYYRSGILHTEQ